MPGLRLCIGRWLGCMYLNYIYANSSAITVSAVPNPQLPKIFKLFLVFAKMMQLVLVSFPQQPALQLKQLVLQVLLLRLLLLRRKPHPALTPQLQTHPRVFKLPLVPSPLSEWDLLGLLWQLEL